ncbi:MAG: hypothetical protein LC624_11030 [Halobacteriales archaeon]|nr:hypothetical protein [Halobacteriales archaeon]
MLPMRLLLSLAALALLLPVAAPPAAAFHQSYFKAEGVAVQGAQVLLATVEYTPLNGGENLNGFAHVALRDAVAGTLVDTTFQAAISQQGFDNDPIPEMFVRTVASLDGGAALSVTGGIFQWEQTPTVFVHGYQGHYQGWTLALVGLQVNGRWT